MIKSIGSPCIARSRSCWRRHASPGRTASARPKRQHASPGGGYASPVAECLACQRVAVARPAGTPIKPGGGGARLRWNASHGGAGTPYLATRRQRRHMSPGGGCGSMPRLAEMSLLARRRSCYTLPAAVRVVRIANRANREAPKSGDSRRIARRSIKSRIARIVI